MLKLTNLLAQAGKSLVNEPIEKTTVVDTIMECLEKDEADNAYVSKRFSPGGYVCARWKAYERLEDFSVSMDKPDAETLALFKSGNAVHDTVQQTILSASPKFFGHWRCRSCGTEVKNSTKPKTVCSGTRIRQPFVGDSVEETCKEVLAKEDYPWEYREIYAKESPLDDDLHEVSCYADGVWLESNGEWRVLEIKSADVLSFTSFSKVKNKAVDGQFILKPADSQLPRQPHVNQGLVCATLISKAAERGEIPLDSKKCKGTIVLYVNRDKFAMKEYHVDYSESPYKELVTLAKQSKQAYDEKNYMLAPPRCTSANNVLAKKCPLRYTCFPK